MSEYRPIVKEILALVADLSLHHGPVELRITDETEEGDFIPGITILTAPDGVVRGLVEDDRIMSMDLMDGELVILPPPEELDDMLAEGVEAPESRR